MFGVSRSLGVSESWRLGVLVFYMSKADTQTPRLPDTKTFFTG